MRKQTFFKDFLVRVLMLAIIFITVICPYNMPGNLYAEHDNSLRIDQNFNGVIDERFQVVSYLFHQINKNMSDYNYIEFGTGLQYQTPLTWLSLLLFYQQSYSQGDENVWLLEQKPSININTSLNASHLRISNQVRYEYRITPAWSDYRIKNYLVLSLHDILLHPYAGWELYYEDHDKAIMLHRIRFGVIQNVYGHVYLGTFYRIDFSQIDDRWVFSRQLVGIQVAMKY